MFERVDTLELSIRSANCLKNDVMHKLARWSRVRG
ncbi:hypothetical protein CO669_18685 [Bradyrhizobium sp. Y36]|nr:hypothetical protein CO669_18685 [Bradyrhizobium sp. Y36]